MTKYKFALLISLSLTFVLGAAQSASHSKPAAKTVAAPNKPAAKVAPAASLPTEADVDAALKRTLGYDPGLSWTIYDIRASAIAGIADVTLAINKQAPQHIYIARGSEHAIIGEMIPFGPNPYVGNRAKLQGVFGPSRSGANPKIQIVEFSDLECPHCKAAQPILEKLQADFPQARFTFQQFPLPATVHPWAMKAAQYADCAGQMDKDAFWKFVDSVFENQGAIALATADDKLKELATAAGYDAQKISACAASPETDARIKKSLDLGQSLDVNSTPTVFMNGRMVQAIANIPYEQLKTLVQFEIDHADK